MILPILRVQILQVSHFGSRAGFVMSSFCATTNDVAAAAVAGTRVPLKDAFVRNAAFLQAFAPDDGKGKGKGKSAPTPTIIQSSEAGARGDHSESVLPARHGLLSAIVDAYNHHHKLVLRPDDVWQAILTQFSFYVNANAEALRDKFVDFDGKKTLVIVMGGTLFSANFGEFANRMVDEQICPNLKDKDVTDWLLPGFSTTQSSDRVAASVTIMSTLQSYFEYVCCLMCGIPEVTLEGTAEDWAQLRAKIDRLPLYAVEGQTVMQDWHDLLAPVLDEFVAAKGGNKE